MRNNFSNCIVSVSIAAAALTCLTSCIFFAYPPKAPINSSEFVTTDGINFVLKGKDFYYVGTNCYYLMVHAADSNLRKHVDEIFDDAAAMGLKIIRTWCFNDGAEQWNALQTFPGVYEEQIFKGLDYVLAKASAVGIRLILVFVNNWKDYGGMQKYIQWKNDSCGASLSHDDFYTDRNIRQWYRNHISTIIHRINTLNGKAYKDDPTIFAWELANEPRCPSDPTGDTLNDWIIEMSAYVKSLDPHHMVTTGLEGFYCKDNGPWWRNGSQGTDFIRNHNISTIDFATVHVWPSYWGMDNKQAISWTEEHIDDAHQILGKPIIIEEFGFYRDDDGLIYNRDNFYQTILNLIYKKRAGGSNFWILYNDNYPDYDGFGIYYPDDTSTVQIITKAAEKMNTFIDF